ncbi:MAG: hypothetical protein IJT43_03925 [Stomatobaculum sp.]|nr:hypothetical protein [Stomatobaculum sp.]
MTAIFLDIDGVLNNLETSVVIPGRKIIGVEDEMVARLREIWDLSEEPVIVLTSTWKEAWEPENCDDGSGYGEEGVYLDEKLGEFGMKISAKTEDKWEERGAGIWRYLEKHPEITKILILDDFSFDFKEQGLYPYWIRTEFEGEHGGLQDSHVKKAARILRLQDAKSFQLQRSSRAKESGKKRGWFSWPWKSKDQ